MKPITRHSVAKAELGECYCPKCAPQPHAQLAPAPVAPAMPAIDCVAVGGDPKPCPEEVARLTGLLRETEAKWLLARGALYDALATCQSLENSIAARQRDLRREVDGVYRERMDAAQVPRPWIERSRWGALTEAQRCTMALASRMASQGPDWSSSVAEERAALAEALRALDALEVRS